MNEIIEKGVRLFRGYLKKILIKKCGKRLLIGKHTELKYSDNIFLGDYVTINSYVEINARSRNGVTIGSYSSIGKYTVIKCNFDDEKTKLKIGNHFGCGDFCFFGCAGGVEIGDDVMMGQNVRFHAQGHIFDDTIRLIREQGTKQKGIIVEDDCWIGGGAVILDGVRIGKGSVIGANALVNKDIPPYSVAVGSPARVIKNREQDTTTAQQLSMY